jgi:hypothetical protein
MDIDSKGKLFKEEARHRELFVARLEGALTKSGYPLSAAAIAHAFHNHYPNEALSVSTVRKWLAAGTYPSERRIVALSKWLGVDAVWLRYGKECGEGPKRDVIESIHEDIPHLDLKELALLRKMLDVVLSCRWRQGTNV